MIQATHLRKTFGRLVALDDVSFTVPRGQAMALWGANGAGKTTALRCLLHLIPFEGTVLINEMNVATHGKEARQMIGFVPQNLSFHDSLSVSDTIQFYASLKKIPAGHDFRPLLTRLQLNEHLDKLVGELSGGLKQRLALALALQSDPPILLLDEPTASLDHEGRRDFLMFVSELKQLGKTIVFTSHRLDEVTAIADRVLLLSDGKMAANTRARELEDVLGMQVRLHLYMSDPDRARAMHLLKNEGVAASQNGQGIYVQVAPGKKGRIMHLLHDAGVQVDDFEVE